MNNEHAKTLYDVYERTLSVLSEAEAVFGKLPANTERDKHTHAYSEVVAHVLFKLRAPLVLEYPELDIHVPGEPPDTLLDPEERDAVGRLTSAQVQQIDDALLANCAPSWRKVARVVGTTMMAGSKALTEIPDGYYVSRVISLVKAGYLESQGNLDYMRFSEVRLSQHQSKDVV